MLSKRDTPPTDAWNPAVSQIDQSPIQVVEEEALDSSATINFLDRLHPNQDRTLTSFKPRPSAVTLAHTSTDRLNAWVRDKNHQSNVYVLIGQTKATNKKPKKEEMTGSHWLWVDIDPRKGKPLEEERRRILNLLTDGLPLEVPPPTIVVDSGRGYWALWELAETVTDIALIERLNTDLASAVGGDSCHNIDRVMRLVGTVNHRTNQTARVVLDDPERVYQPADFAALMLTGTNVATETAAVEIGEAVCVQDLAELDEWNVPDRVKVIIAKGRDPDRPKQDDDSRSVWVFDACCQLIRCGVPPEVILGILVSPAWGISESVFEQRGGKAVTNPERYARQQIKNAIAAVAQDIPSAGKIDSILSEMNARHAVLLQEGGKTRVLSWEKSELDYSREIPVLQSFEDFRNRYLNRLVQDGTNVNGKPTFKPLGTWWLTHPQRRQFMGLRFLPGEPNEVGGYLNMWRGWAVDPAPGDWSLMRAHLEEVVAAGDQVSSSYILNWIAWAIQNPDQPAEVALVLRGGRGSGKGTLARAIKRLHGQHGLQITSPMQLVGRFNAHLRDCCLLFADEAVAPGDKAAESVLKGLITEPELTIEGKGVNTTQARNQLHIIMASNEDWVVPAGIDERRFAVFEVSDVRAGDHDYFAAIENELQSGGLEAMLYDLLSLDLGSWHPRRDVPQTAGLRRQKDLSLPPAKMVVHNMLREGEVPCKYADDPREGTVFVATRLLAEAVRFDTKQERALGDALRVLAGAGAKGVRHGIDQQQRRGFWLPPLDICRERWEQHLGWQVDWPEDVESWDLGLRQRNVVDDDLF